MPFSEDTHGNAAVATESGQNPASMSQLQRKVIGYLKDCHAMERQVYHMLNGLIATTTDPEALERMKAHRHETEGHLRLVHERLVALGSGNSPLENAPAALAAWLKGLYDMARADKPGKNARDAYVTEHVEIAAYSLLERLAERAGDLETAQLARMLAADERQMAEWIDNNWDKFVDLTLQKDRLQPYWLSDEGSSRSGSMHRWVRAAAWAAGLAACGVLLVRLSRGRASNRSLLKNP